MEHKNVHQHKKTCVGLSQCLRPVLLEPAADVHVDDVQSLEREGLFVILCCTCAHTAVGAFLSLLTAFQQRAEMCFTCYAGNTLIPVAFKARDRYRAAVSQGLALRRWFTVKMFELPGEDLQAAHLKPCSWAAVLQTGQGGGRVNISDYMLCNTGSAAQMWCIVCLYQIGFQRP